MQFNFENFIECLVSGFSFLPVTAKLALFTFVIGGFLGFVTAVVQNYKIPVLSQILAAFVTLYSGLPVVVAMLIYYLIFTVKFNDFASFLGLNLTVADVDLIVVAYFALILYALCNTTETFRGALKSIPVNQYEAGYSVGLTRLQTFRRIIMPQMIPAAIPTLINNIVGIIKSTSLVTAVGIIEVTSGSLFPCAVTYSYVEGYAAAGVVYWVFTIVVLFAASKIEKRTKSYRRQPA